MSNSDERLKITPKHRKGEDGYKTFSIRMQEDLVLDIEQISHRTGRSRNELIGILLRYALARCDVEDA